MNKHCDHCWQQSIDKNWIRFTVSKTTLISVPHRRQNVCVFSVLFLMLRHLFFRRFKVKVSFHMKHQSFLEFNIVFEIMRCINNDEMENTFCLFFIHANDWDYRNFKRIINKNGCCILCKSLAINRLKPTSSDFSYFRFSINFRSQHHLAHLILIIVEEEVLSGRYYQFLMRQTVDLNDHSYLISKNWPTIYF